MAGVSTEFLYARTNIVQELSGGIPTTNILVSRSTDEAFTRTDSTGINSFLRDGLGSTVALKSEVGASTTEFTYTPFGETVQSGSIADGSYQYTGRENDGNGLYYYRARYYQPSLQRFISEDPLGLAAGVNVFAYVDNDPVDHRDPSGLMRDCDAEQIECFNDCWNTPTKCLPWPVGRGGGKKARWSRYAYCQSKCLAEYMECEAENTAEKMVEVCRAYPAYCLAAAAAGVAIALQPETAPVLVPVVVRMK